MQAEARMKEVALELFTDLARSYDRTLDVATLLQDRYWKNWVVEKTGTREGGLLLDVGSGTLVLEERLAGQPWSVVGIDLTREMVQVGSSKRLSNVALLVNGDAEELPFREDAFDAVVSCYVAKYVSLNEFVRELSRVTKPGGRLAVYDFVRPRGPLSPFVAMYVQGTLRIVGYFMGIAKRGPAFTFQKLPGIVEGAAWDEAMVRAMEANGVQTKGFQRLTGGVVSAYWGIKQRTRRGQTKDTDGHASVGTDTP
jgi:demethylmenaquinone methyltransferase / 2-methoxy-6-polyprenyl-1,4-benzoquinol methylase